MVSKKVIKCQQCQQEIKAGEGNFKTKLHDKCNEGFFKELLSNY